MRRLLNLIHGQWFRMRGWWVASILALLVVWLVAPHLIAGVIYKLALVTLGVQTAYWADRLLFRRWIAVNEEMPQDVFGGLRLLSRAIVAYAVLNALASGI